MKLMIGILFISLVMFVIVVAYAAVLTTLTLLFTTTKISFRISPKKLLIW